MNLVNWKAEFIINSFYLLSHLVLFRIACHLVQFDLLCRTQLFQLIVGRCSVAFEVFHDQVVVIQDLSPGVLSSLLWLRYVNSSLAEWALFLVARLTLDHSVHRLMCCLWLYRLVIRCSHHAWSKSANIRNLHILHDNLAIATSRTLYIHTVLHRPLSKHDSIGSLQAPSVDEIANEKHDRRDEECNNDTCNERYLIWLIIYGKCIWGINFFRDIPSDLEFCQCILNSFLVHHLNLFGFTVTEVLVHCLFAHDLVLHKSDFNYDIFSSNDARDLLLTFQQIISIETELR